MTMDMNRKIWADDKFIVTDEAGKKYKLVIEQDDFPTDPRTWDNVGTMLCCNRNYQLGDCNDNNSTEEQLYELCRKYGKTDEEIDEMNFAEEVYFILDQENICGLPLYITDHSGLSMQTYRFDAWDSSFVGLIYVEKDFFFAMTCLKDDCDWKAEAKKYLEREVEIYSQFLAGEVFAYTLFEPVEVIRRTQRL